jgi:hypothetical protein
VRIYLPVLNMTDDEWCDAHCVFIDLNADLAKKILWRMDLVAKIHDDDSGIVKISFWEDHAMYLGYEWPGVDEIAIDGEKFLIADRGWDKSLPMATEQMVVYPNEVLWTAQPKHGTAIVNTGKLTRSDIEGFAKDAHDRIQKAAKKRKRRQRKR